MQHRITLELQEDILATGGFIEEFDQIKDANFTSEIEVSSSEYLISLLIGNGLRVTLTPKEAILLSSIILERAYKQI